MRKLKLLGATVLALFAFGAFAASAFAENPEILVLAGEAKEVEGTLKSGTAELINLKGTKTSKAKEAQLLLKNCENLAGAVKDGNLCKDVPLTLSKYKLEETNCRSENNKGEKDPVETVLSLLDLHISSGGTTLGPIILALVLGTGLEEEVRFVCGILKIKLTGVLSCPLSPGLKNTEEVEIVCTVKANDPVIPACSVLCEEFGKVQGLTATYGEEKLDAWLAVTLKGKLNKDVFIND
jgi:hypothetical protein